MKKLCTILLLTASASLLNANGYNGGCSGSDSSYYQSSQYLDRGEGNQNRMDRMDRARSDRMDRNMYQRTSDERVQQQNGFSQNRLDRENNGKSISQNDRELTKDIKDSLSSAFSKKYDKVNVVVNNGNVMLTGTVASEDDRKDLEEKVRDIDGVKNINNQVKVVDEHSSGNY